MVDLISEDEFLQRAINVPMQPLPWELAKDKRVEVIIRRDDLIDSSLSGNKFYKLFYNLRQAKIDGHQQLLSFGGAYSNHLYALAAAGYKFGFNTIGVIRGERPKQLSPTLQDAEHWGMRLHFMSRAEYRQHTRQPLNEMPLEYEGLAKIYGDFYSIPEGGANSRGLLGAKAIGWAIEQKLDADYTAICLASGTGNTLAGIAAGVSDTPGVAGKVLGFSVLKGEGNLGKNIITQQQSIAVSTDNWRLINGYHAGGYAKQLPEAVQNFNRAFERETNLLLDPVYTLKMCWGVAQLLALNYWPTGSRLVLIHTGGLQGRRGFEASL